MKSGRVISGDEHEARVDAEQIRDNARGEADKLLAEARARSQQLEHDAKQLAKQLVRDAREESERLAAQVAHARVPTAVPATAEGRVDEVTGLVVRATVPGVALGELVRIDRRGATPLTAEVVGFRGEQALLLPLGELAGIAPACEVWRTGEPLAIRCGDALLGRVLDGLGMPIDEGPPP